ncbi:MAG TPA: SDR family oxidoreductase [Parapedobacter sp.]|uniref:SDR family NAD(P)-dependent oxidoreductase n=1 Tax=Parapedobacter sp. TaxID=1958893 RepID=UPI002C81C17B|nr:SDR family oxidoreductase [Parapedobacter sp.]HWK58549.1 SDR family oxidoreductase [Parapedobacter sp.]
METKKVIILGGSSGIGKATADRFAKEGYRVFIGSSNRRKGNDVCAALVGEGHRAFEVDVRNSEHIGELAKWIETEVGGFDVLVNSVGVSQGMPALESEFEQWDNALQVMLYGTVKSCRLLVPLLKDGGRVIHITSIHRNRVENGSSAYGMAKAAITQFTRSLALELAPRGILANTVAPGFICTPMSIKAHGNELESDWFRDNYIKYNHLPLKRPGMPEEVAGVVWFLAGSDASYMTGSVVTVDGGLMITF